MSFPSSFALVGNPNCGKSTLFNRLTGLTQKTSNLPGTTVEAMHGEIKVGQKTIHLLDLPGIYSLYTKSEDEGLVVKHLIRTDNDKPEAIIFVMDASNLRRNLLLFSQVAELQIPCACVLTMTDTAVRRGIDIDLLALQAALGVPCIAFNPRKEKNIGCVVSLFSATAKPNIIGAPTQLPQRLQEYQRGAKIQGLSEETLRRYISIEEVIKKCTTKRPVGLKSLTLKIDRLTTHKWGGYFIFAAIMMVLFQGVFSLAKLPMDLIEMAFQTISSTIKSILPDGLVSNFIVQGLIGGMEGVVVFVPQIFILFFLIGLLEDSGYMVRASFITDRIMRKLGLNGRSIIPLVGGFACAIPSIMATRSIKSKRERLATMIVVPLMSCSARLPVYVLLVSVAIPFAQFWGPFHAQTFVITSAYMAGIVVAVILAFIAASAQSLWYPQMPVADTAVLTDSGTAVVLVAQGHVRGRSRPSSAHLGYQPVLVCVVVVLCFHLCC